jgi:exodeoxyribonuclease V gamma subunit
VLKTEEFLDRIRPHLEGGRRDNVAVSLQIGDYSLTGSLGRIYAEHMLHYRPAKMKAADRLRAWIAHLILNHPGVGTPVNKTILCAQDATVAFGPVREAQDYLRVLLCLYGGGLHKPLPFFPDASMMYAERTAQGKGREEALRAARSVRDSDWYDDRQDPYDQLCFRAVDPLNEEFCLLAETICGPMLRYEERITSKP